MNTRPIIVGTVIRFARAGATSVSPAGPVSVALKPDATDAAFRSLGTVAEGSVQTEWTERKIYAPVNGAKQLADVIRIPREMMVTVTLEDYSDEVSAMLFGHEHLGGTGGQFNPGEQRTGTKGWLKLQQTDAVTGSNVTVLDIWCSARLTGAVSFGDEGPRPEVEFTMLYAAGNTGTLLAA